MDLFDFRDKSAGSVKTTVNISAEWRSELEKEDAEDKKIKHYLLESGTLLHFKNTLPQQLYLDETIPESFADLSSVGDENLICAGEQGNALYFYTKEEKDYSFYRAEVRNRKIDFHLIRKIRFNGQEQFLAIQQPFILDNNYGELDVTSFDGDTISLQNCTRLVEKREPQFFCHRGLVYLLIDSKDDAKIVNAGRAILIYLPERYYPKKMSTDFFLYVAEVTHPDNSVYAPDNSLIYVKCTGAVMIISPSHEFFFVEIDTKPFDKIVGVRDGKIVMSTRDGLTETALGKKHEEMIGNLTDLETKEIIANRAEISRLFEENEKLKMKAEEAIDAKTELVEEDDKLSDQSEQSSEDETSEDETERGHLTLATKGKQELPLEYHSKFSSEFTVHKILGIGTFGQVFKATNKLDNGNYAVKRIPVSKKQHSHEATLNEVRAMAQLEHVGIVRYNCTWMEQPPPHWQHTEDEKIISSNNWPGAVKDYEFDSAFIYVQMQLCTSSLSNWIGANLNQQDRSLPRMKSWFKQIVQGVQYIHEKNMIHRDLKPGNILLADEDRLKICDLGLTTHRKFDIYGQEISTLRTPDKWTAMYMSPEQGDMFAIFSSRADVFALGLIFAELCVAMPKGMREKAFKSYRDGKPPNDIFNDDSETADFIAWICTKDTKERPLCSDILNNPYLKESS